MDWALGALVPLVSRTRAQHSIADADSGGIDWYWQNGPTCARLVATRAVRCRWGTPRERRRGVSTQRGSGRPTLRRLEPEQRDVDDFVPDVRQKTSTAQVRGDVSVVGGIVDEVADRVRDGPWKRLHGPETAGRRGSRGGVRPPTPAGVLGLMGG